MDQSVTPIGRAEWSRLAAGVEWPTSALIDGRAWVPGSERCFACTNPATGEVIAEVVDCGAAAVDAAVASARRAFADGRWSRLDIQARKSALRRLCALILDNAKELALMDTLAMGKPIRDAYEADVPGAAAFIEWYAESLDKIYDEVAPTGAADLATITREPIGVVGAIIPWNYPIEEAAVKLGPALAAGNSVVLKPAEQAPFSALRLGELALEAGIPPGVLNVVSGLGGSAGQSVGRHPDIDCVTFTGSTAVGKLLLRYAGESNLKRVWLECGGKSPNIVFEDTAYMDLAVSEAVRSVFRNQGEVCSAGSRLLVQRSIQRRFVDAVIATAQRIVPGDPLDPATRMGPLVSAEHAERVLGYIETGKREGATLALGGMRLRINGVGNYVPPTVFDDAANDMVIAREEIFGPVLAVIPFDTEEEAVAIANDSPYGLVASVWSGSLERAHRVARRLHVGSVTVNGIDAQSAIVPFGGCKQSGIGRERSLHAFAHYTNLKTTWFKFHG